MKENDELKLEIGRLRNNSIIIPENATNRDMFKLVFGEEIYNKTALRIGWLNMSYRESCRKEV
jgi:hypothetical protein